MKLKYADVGIVKNTGEIIVTSIDIANKAETFKFKKNEYEEAWALYDSFIRLKGAVQIAQKHRWIPKEERIRIHEAQELACQKAEEEKEAKLLEGKS